MSRTSILLASSLALLMSFGATSARPIRVLHRFSGGDGASPLAAATLDPFGNLYGTTSYGGANGHGTVFRLGGDFSTLHDFLPAEGSSSGPLLREASGRFLGVATPSDSSTSGLVFEIGDDGTFTTIHTFTDDKVGYAPRGNLIEDAQGNLYGETTKGGKYGLGTVFKLKRGGKAVALYAFNDTDGYNPFGYLLRDGTGTLYGTTTYTGFQEAGDVFKIAPDGTFTKLHQFTNGADGGIPSGGLVLDADGNLYGTAYYGGTNLRGVIYEIAPDGTETVLYNFSSFDGGPSGGLTADASGNLYGSTLGGGSCDGGGCGTLFIRKTNGVLKVLHTLAKRQGDGVNYPLTMDALGTFYGISTYGGDHNNGTVFELKP